MFHRSTSIIAAAGLSAFLLGASPASAGTACRIDVEKTIDRTTVVDVCSLRAPCTPVTKETGTTPRPDTNETPIVSARMAERGYQVRTSGRDTPVMDVCSLRFPCGPRARGDTPREDTPDREVWAYTEDDAGQQERVVHHSIPLAW